MAIPFGQNLSRLTEMAKTDPNRVAQMASQRTPDDPRLVYILALEQAKRARDAVERDEAMKRSPQMPNLLQQYEQQSGLAGLLEPPQSPNQQEVARNVGGILDFQQKQQQEAIQKMVAASKAGGLPSAAGAANVMPRNVLAAGGLVAFQNGGSTGANDMWERYTQPRSPHDRQYRPTAVAGSSTGPIDYDRPAYERRAAAPKVPPFKGPPKTAMLTSQQLNKLASMGAEDLAKQAAAQGGQLSIRALLQRLGGFGAASIIGEGMINAYMKGMQLDRGEHKYGLGSELGEMVSAVAPEAESVATLPAPAIAAKPSQAPRAAEPSMPQAPSAPPFADSDIAERADRMTGMVTPPSEGRVVQSMAAPETTPAIPAPPTATPIPPAYTPARGSMAGLPGDMASTIGQAAVGQSQRDPTSESRIEEERVRRLRELTPDQRRTLQGGISELEQYYRDRAARARDDELTRALIGASGRSTFGMTGAGLAAGALGAREAQAAERLKGIEALNRARSGLIDLDRLSVQEGIAAGAQVRKEGEEGRRTGISSGVQALGYQSQAETARENIAATSAIERAKLLSSQADREMNRYLGTLKDEANRIAKQGQADSRTERLLRDYQQSLMKYQEDVEKAFREENALLLTQEQTNSLSKEAKNQLQLQRLLRDKKINDKRRELEQYIMPLRSRLGMTSAGADGFGALTVK